MQQLTNFVPYSTANLDTQLSALASVEAGRAPFLSCYLDARQGVSACRDFLTDRSLELADGMPARQRALLDETMAMVDTAFGHHWPQGVATVAVFARAGADERFLHILPLIDVVPPQIAWYRLPQIFPMLEAATKTTRFRLLLSRGAAMYVIEVSDGRAKTRAWASPLRATAAVDPISDRDPQTMALRRSLLERSSLPLVVAAAAEELEDIVRWLPGRCKANFVQRVAVPDYLDFNRAIRFVIEDFEDRRRLEAQLEVSRLLRASRAQGLAVLGPLACMEALRRGEVETLVLARGASFARVWHCQKCGNNHACSDAPVRCDMCGGAELSLFDFSIEIASLAKRGPVNIVFSDAEELRYLGGVGCLLTHPVDARAMPLPVPPRRLDLVA